MHIIIISDFAYIEGGATAVALASAIGLAQHGYRVTVFSAVGVVNEELKNNNVTLISTNQFDILNNPSRRAAISQGIWNVKARREFTNLIANCNRKDTIIHVHTWTKALSSSIINVANRLGFKVVCTLHDYFMACPNGGFYNYNTNKICRLTGGSFKCLTTNCDSRNYSHKLWRHTRHLVQNKIGRIPSAIKHFISLSDLSENTLRDYLPSDANIHRIRNPINGIKQTRISAEENNEYIFVGRLSPEKGAVLFARACQELGFTPVFVGDGVCREEILSIAPNAIMHGWLKPQQVQEKLSRARALVFSSQWYEAQPLVIQEANSIGIPCIVSDCCAGRESVQDGVTGLLFDSSSVQDLVDKILILKDDAIVSSMSNATYQNYWIKPPTPASHISGLESVYKSMLDE